jgi:hypothetical protein
MAAARKLDECAERIVALEANRGSRSWGRDRVCAKERIGAHKHDIAGQGLSERDDRERAREEPGSRGCRSESDHSYEDRSSGSD